MPNRENASEIDDVAADWVARAERGLTVIERSELDQWLEGDSRRLGAFVRAQAAWIHAERAAALGKMPEQDARSAIEASSVDPKISRPITRRLLLGGGGAIAASVVAINLIGFQRYRTLESGLGETRHIVLAGGSGLTLDTETTVDILLGSDDRKLILRRGKLFLDTIGDRSMAFTVGTGNFLMEIARGAFALQALLDEPVVAVVTKGALSVSENTGFFEKPSLVTVTGGQMLTAAPGGRLSPSDVRPIKDAQLSQILAWRDGMLSFGGELLADAVRAFDRYGPTRIVVAPELAKQKITGLFKADDPRGFATAVAASFGGVVTSNGELIRISAK